MNQKQHSKQIIRHWRWRRVVWPAVILGGLPLATLAAMRWMQAIGDGVTGWWDKIGDPTERGCAYIATAIAAHALVMAFKSMSHDRIKVEIKKGD